MTKVLSLNMAKALSERWLIITPEVFKQIVEESKSYYEIFKKLGYKGNASASVIEARAQSLRNAGFEISTAHLQGNQGPSAHYDQQSAMTHDESRQNRTNANLLRYHLLKSGRKEECEECGQGPFWNGKPLQLDIDHVDGNPKNNKLENLRFLCAMCHKQAETSSQSAHFTWMSYHGII